MTLAKTIAKKWRESLGTRTSRASATAGSAGSSGWSERACQDTPSTLTWQPGRSKGLSHVLQGRPACSTTLQQTLRGELAEAYRDVSGRPSLADGHPHGPRTRADGPHSSPAWVTQAGEGTAPAAVRASQISRGSFFCLIVSWIFLPPCQPRTTIRGGVSSIP
jgi:hypothetical protein